MSVERRLLVSWFVIALVVRAALAALQTQPGYMDAAYYLDVADALASGRGLTDNFAWNFLNHPQALPQPSNAYWMPLTSLVVAPFLRLPIDEYRAAQLPMVLLAAALVPLTWWISLRLYGRRDWATASAVLMLAASFYTPYWGAIDGFALVALLGVSVAALLECTCGASMPRRRALCAMAAGGAIGLTHLTRADGFLWLVPALWVMRLAPDKYRSAGALFAGYLVVMVPWLLRNTQAFGAPLPGGALFLTNYDDLFSYDKALTLDYLLAAGPAALAGQIGRALLLNAGTLAGALSIVYLPFALLGAWHARHRPFSQAALGYLAVSYGVLSVALSAVSWRGTMLHSLTAVLPALYVFAPVGLSHAIDWIARRRRTWNAARAERVFSIAFLLIAVLISAYFYLSNITGGGALGWNDREAVYRDIGTYLAAQRDGEAPVMCINPPAYWYFNRRPAIAVPSDSVEATLRAARQFGARYLVLEPDLPRPLKPLYADPASDARFVQMAEFRDAMGAIVRLFRIE